MFTPYMLCVLQNMLQVLPDLSSFRKVNIDHYIRKIWLLKIWKQE